MFVFPMIFVPFIINFPAGLASTGSRPTSGRWDSSSSSSGSCPPPPKPTPEEAAKPSRRHRHRASGSAGDERRELPADPAERVRAILERVVDELDLDARSRSTRTRTRFARRVEGDELGLLIGRHGQTIDALQLLCYRAAFQGMPERKRVSVDAAGYRARRAEVLHREADQAAERASSAARSVDLEPMTSTSARSSTTISRSARGSRPTARATSPTASSSSLRSSPRERRPARGAAAPRRAAGLRAGRTERRSRPRRRVAGPRRRHAERARVRRAGGARAESPTSARAPASRGWSWPRRCPAPASI